MDLLTTPKSGSCRTEAGRLARAEVIRGRPQMNRGNLFSKPKVEFEVGLDKLIRRP